MILDTNALSAIGEMRTDYVRGKLQREDLNEDPVQQFAFWFDEACRAGLPEPNAVSLATVGADGRPLVRTVLVKHFDAAGFIFFTNLESTKATQIAQNPNVSLLFPWLLLERQVIINGTAARLPLVDVAKYFLTRPRDSRVAAWVSQQSRVVSARRLLEAKFDEMMRKFGDGEIPVPSFWGGFRVAPRTIEFWQGGTHRLHDRFQYRRSAPGAAWSSPPRSSCCSRCSRAAPESRSLAR